MGANTSSEPPTGQTSSVDRAWGIVIGTAALAMFVLALIDVVRGPWDHDSGYFLLRASLIADGLRPFLDFRSLYPPLIDCLHAIPMALGASRYALAFVLPGSWITANAAASVALTRTFGYSWKASLTAGVAFLILSIENGGNHVTLEHGVVFFGLAAFATLNRAGALTAGRLFVAGLCVSSAILSKQNGAVVFFPAIVMLLERRSDVDRTKILSTVCGIALPFLLLLAWLDFSVGRIYANVVERLGDYAEGRSTDVFALQWEFLRSAPTAALLVLAVAAGLLAMLTGPRRTLAAVALAGAALEFAPRLLRNYPHYTLNIWPFTLLVILLASRSRIAKGARLARGSTFAVLLSSFLIMFLSQTTERWQKPGYLATVFQPAAEVLRGVSPAEERVRMYAAEPIVPYLAYRLPEEIETADAALTGVWDGSHLVGQPLPETMPVVLVDRGDGWVEPLRRDLEQAGFVSVFDRRPAHDFRLTVYHRERGHQ